jgi:hypothetical protein
MYKKGLIWKMIPFVFTTSGFLSTVCPIARQTAHIEWVVPVHKMGSKFLSDLKKTVLITLST